MGRSASQKPAGVEPRGALPIKDHRSVAEAGLTLTQTLDAIREIVGPALDETFAEQRATWEREGPAAMAALAETGATLDQIGGNCPVQAEGSVDGQRFYFRARGENWQFHVAPTDALIWDAPSFYINRDYGDWPDAGWMPQHEAIGFIVEAIAEYRTAPDADDGQPDEAQEWADLDPDC